MGRFDLGYIESSNIRTVKEHVYMTLTKVDIVKFVAKQNGFSESRSKEVVETLLELIKGTLASGEHVMISSFGRFSVKEKKLRRGRNPSTGDDLMLAPRRVVTFRISGKLRKKVNS